MRAILDTSVFIARETRRRLRALPADAETAVSIITLAELRIGVLTATEAEVRARRLSTLESALRDHQPLPVDESVAEAFAGLVATVKAAGRNPRVLDGLIAATAIAHDAVVATQDDDFDDLPGLTVVRV